MYDCSKLNINLDQDLQIIIALFSSMSKLGIILEHTGTSPVHHNGDHDQLSKNNCHLHAIYFSTWLSA